MHQVPSPNRQLAIDNDTATLVRGEDRYGHFRLTPRPSRDLEDEFVRLHVEATGSFRAVVFKNAARVRRRC